LTLYHLLWGELDSFWGVIRLRKVKKRANRRESSYKRHLLYIAMSEKYSKEDGRDKIQYIKRKLCRYIPGKKGLLLRN